MSLLSKELFISTIESIRLQYVQDVEYSNAVSTVFNISDGVVPPYNNSLLIKSLVSLLQFHFPRVDGHCAIEHYMFDLNFGRISHEKEVITIEDLWYQITKDGSN